MALKINSASRLHSIIIPVLSEADNSPVMEVWARALKIEEPNAHRKAALVGENLRWLHHELELLKAQILESGISESLYSKALTNIEAAISNLYISGTWNQVKQYLGADVILALGFFIEMLPDEENKISNEELEEIQAQLNELLLQLQNTALPERLVQLIKHHIELIQSAILAYPIKGAKSLREAARTGLGEILEVKEEIKEHAGSTEIKGLVKIWEKFNSAADLALKVEKLSLLGQKIWAVIAPFM